MITRPTPALVSLAAALLSMLAIVTLEPGCGESAPSTEGTGVPGAERYAPVTIRHSDPANAGVLAYGKRERIYERELAKVNARIEWVPAVGAFSANFDAMNSGAINAASAAISPIVGALSRNLQFQIYSISDPGSTQLAGILSPRGSDIRTVRDLVGHRVAVNLGAHGDYMLLRALQNEGIPADRVTRVPIQPPDAAAAFATGQIDAWSVFGAYYTTAVRNGANVIVREEDLRSDDVGVSAANVELLRRNPAAFQTFLRVTQELVELAHQHPERFQNVFTSRGPTAISGEELQIAIDDTRRLPLPRVPTANDRTRIANVAQLLYANDSLDREIAVDEIVFDLDAAAGTLALAEEAAR
ncbi:ABC transporter substrate-binding protein [Sandaracinus amylolyticus]|uniref:ABC transporter substrate-binding protein n=1 Tax=Sandaracinus amylolyticus TaxID=927083 RepID=UPI001F3044B7|nr:NrtA/SsuA/CpmA family ABC transporter substrate-binding protein [Sandaracinus amylolyticus]UJR83976.1 Hypothetical protein I5071_60470 [Sandaracinus amylolyticus]